ncbi:hypothetical protein D3C71_855650 [compost metagenome]
MRNFYSCGCYVADDVPVISRCGEHNGFVICRTGWRVTNPRQLIIGKRKRLKIIHHNLYDVLERLQTPVDLVFAYPEHDMFVMPHMLTPFGFRNHRLEVFDHVLRLLKPEGKAVFLIDPIDLGSITYQALLRKFEVHTRFFPVYIRPEPLWSRSNEKHKVYKIAVGLNTGPLPKLRVDDLKSFFDGLDVPREARILDLSCIHIGAVKTARPDSTIVGICEDANRYRKFCDANS